MFEQDMVTRLILSIKRVKEPLSKFEIRRVFRGGGITFVITLFSWRVRVGEKVIPLVWWAAGILATYFGFGSR